MLNRFKQWVIRKTFSRYYSYFVYPFTNADEAFADLTQLEKYHYLDAAVAWYRSSAYKVEVESLIRRFYQELASKPTEPEQVAGYRLCLIFLSNLEKRMEYLKQLAEVEESNIRANKSIN